MNILPKKRWHVRTRENIARVRRDEAKAAEEEKQRRLRVEKAEREARLNLLRHKVKHDNASDTTPEKRKSSTTQPEDQHVNLFYELEQDYVTDKANPEYEKEKKLEKEKYEMQIGYLTYLGQDTNEITGNVSWYNKDPNERKAITEEVGKKFKKLEDPLTDIKKYLGSGSGSVKKAVTENVIKTNDSSDREKRNELNYISLCGYTKDKKKLKKEMSEKKKRKKKKKRKHSSASDSSSDSDGVQKKKKSVSLENLRAERLKREMEERKRATLLLKKVRGETCEEDKVDPEIEQKYNSQFNPHLAKQNVYKK